jgi:hypothetical protein
MTEQHIHHPTRIWVGGVELPSNRGILIQRGEPDWLEVGFGAPIIAWHAPPEAFFTKLNHLDEYVKDRRVPEGLYITMQGERAHGVKWRMWYLDGVGEMTYQLPAGYGQRTMAECNDFLSRMTTI